MSDKKALASIELAAEAITAIGNSQEVSDAELRERARARLREALAALGPIRGK